MVRRRSVGRILALVIDLSHAAGETVSNEKTDACHMSYESNQAFFQEWTSSD